jgi:hypothetical protein
MPVSERDASGLPSTQPRPPQPAARFSRGVTTGDTIYVACKLPGGLILRCFEMVDHEEQTRNGIQVVRQAAEIPDSRFVIKGPWAASGGQAFSNSNGFLTDLIPGGYAITEGVPLETWSKWYQDNKNGKLVREGFILAHRDRAGLIKECRDLAGLKTGMEPIDPKNPAEKMGGTGNRAVKIEVLTEDEGTSRR